MPISVKTTTAERLNTALRSSSLKSVERRTHDVEDVEGTPSEETFGAIGGSWWRS